MSSDRPTPDQYKYLIGENGEGLTWGAISKGAQVTPPRLYMTDNTDKFIPIKSDSFSPLESLGYGGLGIGWGLQCWTYSDADLREAGLNVAAMRKAYEVVSSRIGINATNDTASKYTIGKLKTYQPAARTDRNHRRIQDKYAKNLSTFTDQGVYVGRTPLALLTEDLGNRGKYRYRDMDFYSDDNKSAWRPGMTVNELQKKSNFTYIHSRLVTKFSEKDDLVTVSGIDTDTGKEFSVKCRKLILASGALGTARIMLRSLGNASSKLPMLSNPHSYIPCLQPAMVGKASETDRPGFGQLSYFIDPAGNDSGISVASSYSYQSLMLFRIITQTPFNLADSRILLQYLMSGFMVVIAQHPDYYSENKYLRLAADQTSPTGDALHANYSLSAKEENEWDKREKQYVSTLRKLNTYAIKRVKTEHGSAIHYAGTVPFSKRQKEFSLTPEGRLHGSRHVYVADSSGFNFLPAKGLTFSLMANAHITAQNALENK